MAGSFDVKCDYCGASAIVMADSYAEAVALVSEDCECGGYKKEQAYKKACDDIDDMFSSDAVSVAFKDLLKSGLKMSKMFAIDSVSVKYGGYSGTVSRTKDGFKVSRRYSEKNELGLD